MTEKVSPPIDPELGTDIVTWLRETVDKLIDPKDLLKLKIPAEAYAGRIFEETAFRFLSTHLPQPSNLLSPYDTFLVYRRLYPKAPVVASSTDSYALRRVTVPDGLLYNPWKEPGGDGGQLTGVYEYTIRQHPPYKQRPYMLKKIHGFKLSRNQYPEVFSHADLRFVLPADTKVPSGITGEAKIVRLPFSREEFLTHIEETTKLKHPARQLKFF
jgi:hypothetical protein